MQKALILCKAYFDGKNVGGAGVYTAAALSRLGVSTAVAAKIDGEFIEKIREFFWKNGVDDSFITEKNGENFDVLPDDFDVVFITGEFVADNENSYSFAKKICEDCRKLEIPVVFDPGNFGENESAEKLKDIALRAEVFVPAVEDAKLFCGLTEPEKIADLFISMGGNKIVITLGKQGAFFKSHVESGDAPTFRADKVVDVTGAGDAFAAGLISGIIEKIPLSEAVVRANACGCCAIQSEGFRFPAMQELREYMLTHRFVVEGCKDY